MRLKAYFNKFVIYLYCIWRILTKRRISHESDCVFVISIQHIGESILFMDEMRELCRYFRGKKVFFIGNRGSVDIYKEYLNEHVAGYISVDKDYGLYESEPSVRKFLRLCADLKKLGNPDIVLPFRNFWGFLAASVLSYGNCWMIGKKPKDKEIGSRMYWFINSHAASTIVVPDDEDSLSQQYKKLLVSIGLKDYQAKIGRISLLDSDIDLPNVHLHDNDYCVIVPGSQEKARQLEWEKYAEIIGYIREKHGLACAITGSKEEELIAENIKSRYPLDDKVIVLAGKTTIKQLNVILKKAAFAVGNDTGTTHLCAALGVQYIAITSYKDYLCYLPYNIDVVREDDRIPIPVYVKPMPECAGCGINSTMNMNKIQWKDKDCKDGVLDGGPFMCIRGISTKQVTDIIDELAQ